MRHLLQRSHATPWPVSLAGDYPDEEVPLEAALSLSLAGIVLGVVLGSTLIAAGLLGSLVTPTPVLILRAVALGLAASLLIRVYHFVERHSAKT